MWIIILLVILALIFLISCCKKESSHVRMRHNPKESFASSDGGALIQLTSKDPQDSYLMTGTEKYWLYPWSYPWYYPNYYDGGYYPYYPYYPRYGFYPSPNLE